MRVLLCQSYLGTRSSEPLVFPLGLSYLAASIKDKHEVTCFDPNVSSNPMGELVNLINKVKPEVIGVSFRNLDSAFSFNKRSFYDQFLSLIRLIKKKAPSAKLIVGGPGFSIFAQDVMKNTPEIDVGMISEGELAFPELLENINNPEHVKSLLIRKNGEIVHTGERKKIDFDSVSFPARELFDLAKYREYPFAMGLQARRGCSFECSFCANREITGNFFRLRSPEKVVDELEHIVNDLGFDSFYFADATFNYPLEYSEEICNEIIKRKIKVRWQADFHLLYVNKPFIETAIKSGCDLFSYSPDGASDNALRFLGKNFGVDAIRRTIDLTVKVDGANAAYSFLYDLPRYNEEHMNGLMQLAPEMMVRLGSKLRFLSYSKIRIYPNTVIHKVAIEDGKINRDASLIYPIHYTSNSFLNLSDKMVMMLRGTSMVLEKLTKNSQNKSLVKKEGKICL